MTVTCDETEGLVLLQKDQRDPVVRLTVEDSYKLKDALLAAANHLDVYLVTSKKTLEPIKIATDIWEAKVGYFDGGVAIQFSQAGTCVPLPPAVARHLANRLQSAINAAETGLTIQTNSGTPTKTFGMRAKPH